MDVVQTRHWSELNVFVYNEEKVLTIEILATNLELALATFEKVITAGTDENCSDKNPCPS